MVSVQQLMTETAGPERQSVCEAIVKDGVAWEKREREKTGLETWDKRIKTPIKHNFIAFFRQVGCQIQLFPTKEVNIYSTEIKQLKSVITLMLTSTPQEPQTD